MITNHDLLDWLQEVDKKLSRNMTVIAVGGTALTILGLKESTRDVDFCISSKNFIDFKKAAVTKKFVVDLFQDGYIFTLQLPKDYEERAEAIPFSGKHLSLKVLSLEDIILTKTARFATRDIEDIKAVVVTGKIKLEVLKKRFREVFETYGGRDEDYQYHFELMLKMFFGKEK